MDLIGIPIRITIGKNAIDNKVEFKLRNSDDLEIIDYSAALEKINELIRG